MFFKSKISVSDFANCILRDHQSIFGLRSLGEICNQINFQFRDQATQIESFYELQAFGLYSMASGVKTQCGQNTRAAILSALDERFATGPNWQMLSMRVREFEEFSAQGPIGGFAAQLIFDHPRGIIPPQSKDAFELAFIMNEKYFAALKAVGRLFKEFKVAV